MAFVKVCDNCGNTLGGELSFIQTKGSVSDQFEPSDGRVEFRYLTDRPEEIHTFCKDTCDMDWRDKQRKLKRFSSRV